MIPTSRSATGREGPDSSPEALLLITIAKQAVKDYWCYRWREGHTASIAEGGYVRKWADKMEGSFPFIAQASGFDVENFREMFLKILDDIDNKIKPHIVHKNVHNKRKKRDF